MKIADWVQGSPGNDKDGNPIPGEVYEIHRYGRSMKIGGGGTVWFCGPKVKGQLQGCPSGGDLYPTKRCRHLKKFMEAARTPERVKGDPTTRAWPKQIHFTAEGRRAATRCKCPEKA